MSSAELSFWFMVTDRLFENGYSIFCAESEQDLFKALPFIKEDEQVSQLTWGGLSKLTGCIIPCYRKPDDNAKGSLMFIHNGNFITITCGIFRGY